MVARHARLPPVSPPRRLAGSVMAAAMALAGCGTDAGDAVCGPVEPAVEPAAFHTIGTAAVDYRYSPPASGPHAAGSAPAPGVYDEPIPEARQVAAAEVGMVLLQYDPSLPTDQRERLAGVGRGVDGVIVAPVGSPIDDGRLVAMTAWEQRQLCDGVDEEAAQAFVRRFVGRGPGEA